MGVINPGGASSPDFSGKTLIADKLTLNVAGNDTIQIPNGAALQDLNGAGGNFRIFFDHNGVRPVNVASVLHNGQASNEAAGATAGGGAALPATVAGFFVFQDVAGNSRKVPFYAN